MEKICLRYVLGIYIYSTISNFTQSNFKMSTKKQIREFILFIHQPDGQYLNYRHIIRQQAAIITCCTSTHSWHFSFLTSLTLLCEFTSNEFKKFLNTNVIKDKQILKGYPQEQGKVEAYNKIVISEFLQGRRIDWRRRWNREIQIIC